MTIVVGKEHDWETSCLLLCPNRHRRGLTGLWRGTEDVAILVKGAKSGEMLVCHGEVEALPCSKVRRSFETLLSLRGRPDKGAHLSF